VLKSIRTAQQNICPVCSSPGIEKYHGMSDRLFSVPGAWSMKKCSQGDCGAYWLDPMPLEEDIHLAYIDYITHDSFSTTGGKAENILYRLMRGAVARTTGMLLKRSIGIDHKRQQLSNLCLDYDTPGKLFEVGCGSGDFLERMRSRGWNVEGVDFDPEAVRNVREKHGLTISAGTMEHLNLPDETYDVVALSHVIEHIYDPVSLLKECFRVLKPSGKLTMTTPNTASFGHNLYREFWFPLDPPRHITLYSQKNLGVIVKRAGFKTVKIVTSAANAEGVLRGSYHIKKSGRHLMTEQFKIHEIIKYMSLQFFEHLLVSRGKPVGEELLCTAYKQ
jgi:2-polyprenyl-3-methyl-5-hydroxy-6-metoxy-1,4-benzoquinol methylase